jgi:predicted regulator of Ras-like GTPase activity (Roadblock/LC7/MglB family)
MKDKFEKIESVNGLRQLMALDRKSMEMVYASKSVNSGMATELLRQLVGLRNNYPEQVNQVIINFSESKLLMYNLRDYVLVLHVNESFNVQEMRKALQEANTASDTSPKRSKDAEVLESLEKIKVSGDHLLVYQKIVELLMTYAKGKLNAFVAANKLRESKEKLHNAYKLLQAFIVGKDGSVVFRNTPETSVAMASHAMAAWALGFFRKCQEINPEFPSEKINELIGPEQKQWGKLGFAEALREEKLVSDLDT